jgi:cbb3-type cytochrome oxidase maturation protein
MDIIWILVPVALLMGVGFLVFFIWAAKSGQFEDLETPAVRMLFEVKTSEVEKEKMK